jgi:division protein CdvB (Snf7/Vps24/ESCRT-III family)
MGRDIIRNWEEREPSINLSKLSGHIRPQIPLKEKIAQSVYRLKVQQSKLESSALKMQRHDRNLFDKCIAAQMVRDTSRAALYASECAEIRKMASTVLRCELALEKVILRLENIQLFGDTAAMLGPVAKVVESIKSQISGVMPEVSYALGEIGETLNNVCIEVGEATGQQYDESYSDPETQQILNEASAVAAQRMNERFPDLPKVAIPAGSKYSEAAGTQ